MANRKRIKVKTSSKLRNHALKVGELIHVWNHIHVSFFIVFMSLMGKSRFASAKNIWDYIGSDNQQRAILKAMIDGVPKNKHLDEILWVIKKVNAIAPYRNSYAHTAVYDPKDIVEAVKIAAKPNYALKLTYIESKKLFPKFKRDLFALDRYVYDVSMAIIEGFAPLPDRPVLLALPDQTGADKKKTRQKKSKTPLSQPQS